MIGFKYLLIDRKSCLLSLARLCGVVIVMVSDTQRSRANAECVKSVNQMCVKPVYAPPHFKPQKLIFFEKTIENPPFLGL
ncbi:hypothetical protein QREC_QR164_02311 [Escherichia coli]|nr:hypothetical protein QREC_QR164_02311 [Escherichia coli]